jgi:hypothetical protein
MLVSFFYLGRFGRARHWFCFARRSCGTVRWLLALVLSRITLFRDNSVALRSRFVSNHSLSGQFSCSPISFCLESLSFGTIQLLSAYVLSRITLFRDNPAALRSCFVSNHSLSGQFSCSPHSFCPKSSPLYL